MSEETETVVEKLEKYERLFKSLFTKEDTDVVVLFVDKSTSQMLEFVVHDKKIVAEHIVETLNSANIFANYCNIKIQVLSDELLKHYALLHITKDFLDFDKTKKKAELVKRLEEFKQAFENFRKNV